MKITTAGKQLVASIKNARLKAVIATKHLVAEILVGQFLLFRQYFESLGLTDAITKLLGLNKSDTVNTSETLELDTSKSVSDSTQFVDTASKSVGKTADNTASTSDSVVASIGKNISDTVSFSDSVGSAVGFGAGDTVYATDDVGAEATIDDDQYMLFGKNLIEAPSVSETVSLTAVFQRAFSESINVSDAFNPVLGKLPTESLSMTEIIELLAGKGVSDTLSTTDSGSLISQDYVNNNQYFDADYVGQFRTF